MGDVAVGMFSQGRFPTKNFFYENIQQPLPSQTERGGFYMSFTKEFKTNIITKYQVNEKDTGSSEVQIALLTERLNYLNDHFKTHGKDHHSRHGLIRMVNRRRKLLDYLKREDAQRYQTIIKELGIRR
jgi:small subunit ribosomal protein S15